MSPDTIKSMTIAQFAVYAVAVSTGIVNFILAILVIKEDPRNKANIVLALYITFLNIVLQIVSIIIVTLGNDLVNTQRAMLFGQLVMYIPFIYYIFVRIYITGKVGITHWLILVPYFTVTTILCLFYTNTLFTFEWSTIAGYYIIQPNLPLYIIQILAYVYIAIASYYLYQQLKSETVPIRKTRLKYILISPIFPAIGLLMITFPSIHFLPWDMIGTTVSTVLLSYVVLEHDLLEIHVAVKESLVYSFFTISVMVLFAVLSYIAVGINHDDISSAINPVTITAILLTTTVLYIIYRRGATTTKVLEEERIVQNQILETINKTSHNLRTPLTAISGYLEVLEKKTNHLPLDIIHDINAIAASTLRMSLQTENLLVYSQLSYERYIQHSEPIDINQLVSKVTEKYTPLTDHRNLTLSTHLLPTTTIIIANRQYVSLSIENLIANAIQFTAKGTISVELRDEKSEVKVVISDTGVGLSGNVLEAINKGILANIETKPDDVGIGLKIVGMVSETLNGTYGATSTPGIGSTVWFTIPKTQ